ncbi:uncharacterized protein [Nicotiana tomentosiformis]|uniref:uncharacterized protein n=1 Tax=Nicotiana tomentosiformis TaxID=4098 RepID=UPI00388CD8CE
MGYTEVEGFYLINPKSNEFVLIENNKQLYNIVCHLNHLDLFIKHVVNEPLLVDETVSCGLLCGPEVIEPSETTLNKEAKATSIVPEDINVQESAANNTFVAEENLADVGVAGENLQGAEETTNIDVGLASDLSSNESELDKILNEDDSDVNEDLTSLRPSKKDTFAGKLGGDGDYYTSSDIGSDDSTNDLNILAERRIDLPPRRRSKKMYCVHKGVKRDRKILERQCVLRGCVIIRIFGERVKTNESLYDKEYWCRAYFKEDSKCVVIENNMCEIFNSWIIGPRHKSVITMLEEIGHKIMNKTIEMRKFAETWVTDIVPMARMILEENKAISRRCKVMWNTEHGFEVDEGVYIFIVNFRTMTCTCRSWMLRSILCQHAVCAFYDREMDPDDYVARWYRKETFLKAYQHFIQPIPNMKMRP